MKVKELIEKLEELDEPDEEVFFYVKWDKVFTNVTEVKFNEQGMLCLE